MKYPKVIVAIAMLSFVACKNEVARQESEVAPIGNKVQAHGKANHVLVVADSALWEGAVGDTFSYYFGTPYLLLPEPEPIFDLKHMTPEELVRHPLNKEFRTIIFLADMDDEDAITTRLLQADLGAEKMEEIKRAKGYNVTSGQDKWAASQQLFYVYGFGEQRLSQCIEVNFPAIALSINERDHEAIRTTTYIGGEEYDLQAGVLEKFNLHIKLPKGFRQEGEDPKTHTLWLEEVSDDHSYNILLRKLPYQTKAQLTETEIKRIREEAAQAVRTGMATDARDLPIFIEHKTFNGIQAVQAKGIFSEGNGFKRGAFVSNLLLNEKTNELVLVDGFVYSKGKYLRDHMQALELVLSTASF